jgi:hypothetical protein
VASAADRARWTSSCAARSDCLTTRNHAGGMRDVYRGGGGHSEGRWGNDTPPTTFALVRCLDAGPVRQLANPLVARKGVSSRIAACHLGRRRSAQQRGGRGGALHAAAAGVTRPASAAAVARIPAVGTPAVIQGGGDAVQGPQVLNRRGSAGPMPPNTRTWADTADVTAFGGQSEAAGPRPVVTAITEQ